MLRSVNDQSSQYFKSKDFTIIEDILFSSNETLDLAILPSNEIGAKERNAIFSIITNNVEAKGYSVFHVTASISDIGFQSSTILRNAEGKQMMYLPFQEKTFGGNDTGGGVPVSAKVKSAHPEKDGDNTVLVVDGTTNNRDWEVRLTLNKNNIPIHLEGSSNPRTYFT